MKHGITLFVAAFLLVGCNAMKREAITSAMHDIWEEGNLDRIDANYEPELAYEVRQFVEDNRALYPDLELTIDRIVIEGNTFVTQWTVKGTHRDLGQPVVLTGVSIRERVDGKIVSEQMFYDTKSIYDQLGFTMTPPEGATPFDAMVGRGEHHDEQAVPMDVPEEMEKAEPVPDEVDTTDEVPDVDTVPDPDDTEGPPAPPGDGGE